MARSANSPCVAATASPTISRSSQAATCHSILPDSILDRSRKSLISRVSRSDSRTMICRNSRALLGLEIGRVEQDLGERADRGQGRAQLVADGGEEIVLELVELAQPLVRVAQLGRGLLERQRLLLQPLAVLDHLRGLVQDLHQIVRADHLAAHDRAHHHPRAGGADRAGQLALGQLDQRGVGCGVGRQHAAAAAQVGGEHRVGPLLAQEADQAARAGPRPCASPRQSSPTPAALVDVDEQHRLHPLELALPAEQARTARRERC